MGRILEGTPLNYGNPKQIVWVRTTAGDFPCTAETEVNSSEVTVVVEDNGTAHAFCASAPKESYRRIVRNERGRSRVPVIEDCLPVCPEFEEVVTMRSGSLGKSIQTLGDPFKGGFTLQGVGTSTDFRDGGGGGSLAYSIPEGATLCKAILWWNTLTNRNTELTTIQAGGAPLIGIKVGQGLNTCWDNGSLNRVYRADVTSRIAGNSGALAVSGFPNQPQFAPLDSSQGAALLLIYTSPRGKCTTLHIYDGCLAMNGDIRPPFQLNLPLEGGKARELGFGIGDGQMFDTDDIRLNNVTLPNSQANGRDGPFMDAFSVLVPPGATAPLAVRSNYFDDCLSFFLVVHAF